MFSRNSALIIPNETDKLDETVDVTVNIIELIAGGLVAFALGFTLTIIAQAIIRAALRRRPLIYNIIKPTSRPLQFAIGLLAAWVTISYLLKSEQPEWLPTIYHIFIICEIIALTWLITSLIQGAEQSIVDKVKDSGGSRWRKIQTQMQILQRVITATIWVLGFAVILLTFPSARTIGTSLFASAGFVSIVVGIAAQTTLGNVFAGLQLAFSDSIRVGDVVTWNTVRCVVEEITLTYVVLRAWDGRRMIVPSSQMTTTSFENWTRRSSELLEHIDFRLDWSAPIPEIRAHMSELLEAVRDDLWDGKTGILKVRDTDDTNGIQVSLLVSAKNSLTMIDLSAYLREGIVRWLQENYPEALPHTRYFNYNFDESVRPGGTLSSISSPIGTQALHAIPPTHKPEKKQKKKKTQKPPALSEAPTEVLSRDDIGLHNTPERVPIAQRATPTNDIRPGHESSIFTGSVAAEERANSFEAAGAAVAAEREEVARRREENATEKPTDTHTSKGNDKLS